MLRKLLFLGILLPVLAWTQTTINTPAKFVLLQDFETGNILYSKAPTDRMYPASMTKMMTAYVAFEEIKANRLSLTDEVTISKKAHAIKGSRTFLEIGAKVSVETLLKGIIVQSGNDASVALAEHIGGSEIGFASIMNDVARQLNMKNSNFVNASGWPNENHYTTAEDLMRLVKATIKNFPNYYSYYSETVYTYAGIKQGNRNPLLYAGIGADGLKTGYTDASGFGLAASAVAGDRRLLLVVNGLDSAEERKEESTKLMEWGLLTFNNYRILHKGDEVGQVSVHLGQETDLPVVIEEDVILTLEKSDRRALEVAMAYNSPIAAPIAEGTRIGSLEISARGKLIHTLPIYAGASVEALSFWDKIKRRFSDLLG